MKEGDPCAAPLAALSRVQLLDQPLRQDKRRIDIIILTHRVISLLSQHYIIYRMNLRMWNWNLLVLCLLMLCRQPLEKHLLPPGRGNPSGRRAHKGAFLRPMRDVARVAVVLNLAYLVSQMVTLHPVTAWMTLLLPVALHLACHQQYDHANVSMPIDLQDRMALNLMRCLTATMETTLITCLVPVAFVPDEFVYYDSSVCLSHALIVLATSLVVQLMRFLSLDFVEYYVTATAAGGATRLGDGDGTPKGGGGGAGRRYQDVGDKRKLYGGSVSHAGAFTSALLQGLVRNPGLAHNGMVASQGLITGLLLLLVMVSLWWRVYAFMLAICCDVFLECLQVRRENVQVYAAAGGGEKDK